MNQLNHLYEGVTHFSITQYCSSGSVQYALVCTFLLGTIIFALNKLTNEYSWVDRIWSLLPIFYGFHFIYHQSRCTANPLSDRQIIMISLTTLWGLRLTYNFYRKGGFSKGGQDYRWQYLRKNYHWVVVELLNFFFISYYQIVLILWFASPIYLAYEGSLNINDYILTGIWLALYLGEVIADQQQWNFQTQKYRLLKQNNNKLLQLPSKYRIGFVTGGLFKFSRHPNFFCQISLWYVQFLFSVNSVGLNYTGLGAILLNLLFLGSTTLTERISKEKYPRYGQYQKTTSMLIPLPVSSGYLQLQQQLSKKQ